LSTEGNLNSALLADILNYAKSVGYEPPHFANVVVDLSAVFATNCTRPLTDLRVTAVRVVDLEASESKPYLARVLETQSTDKINATEASALATTVVEALGGSFSKLRDFAKLANGLDATQAEAAATRLIAYEQQLAGDSLQDFFNNLSLKIGTSAHGVQMDMLQFFREIWQAPLGQEKRLGELVDLTNTMHRTKMVRGTDVIDALDKCDVHPLFVHPKTRSLQVSRRVFEYAIDRMVNYDEHRCPAPRGYNVQEQEQDLRS
jgi:hypothetical protein